MGNSSGEATDQPKLIPILMEREQEQASILIEAGGKKSLEQEVRQKNDILDRRCRG